MSEPECKTLKQPCPIRCVSVKPDKCRAKPGEGANYKGKKVPVPKANSPVKAVSPAAAVSPEVVEYADEDVMMSLVFDLRLDDLETKPEESVLENLDEKKVRKSLKNVIDYFKLENIIQIYGYEVKENFVVLNFSVGAIRLFKVGFNSFLTRVKMLNDRVLDSENMRKLNGINLSLKNVYLINKVTPFNTRNVLPGSKYLVSIKE